MSQPVGSRSLLGGAAVLAAGRYVVAALGWVGTLVVVRALTASEFGALTAVFSLLGVVGLLSELRMGRVVLDDLQRAEPAEAGRLAGAYVGLRVAIGLAGWLAAIVVTLAFGWPASVRAGVALAGAVLVVSSAWYGYVVVCQAHQWHRAVATSQVAAQAVQLACTVSLAAFGLTTVVWFSVPAVVNACVALAVVAAAVRTGQHVRVHADAACWRRWVRDAAPLSVGYALETLYLRVDVLMLSLLGTFGAVGAYGVAVKFGDLVGAVPVAVLGPTLALLVAAGPDDARFHATVRAATVVLGVVGAGAVACFWALAPELVPGLFGARYAASAGAARLVVAGQALHCFTALCVTVLAARGARRWYPLAALGGLALNVGLNAAWIPSRSFDGAALATLVTEGAVVVAVAAAAVRVTGVRPLPVAPVVRAAGVAGTVALAATAVRGAVAWPVLAMAAPLAYLAGLHLVGVDGPGGLRALARRTRLDLLAASPRPATGAARPSILAAAPGPLVSGAETVLLRLLGGLHDSWQVTLACPEGPLAARAAAAGLPCRPLPDVRFPAGRGVARALRYAWRTAVAARQLRRAWPEDGVVLVNGIHLLPAVRLARLGRDRRSPAVLLLHDVVVRRDRVRLLRLGARCLDRAIAVSDAAAAPARAAGIDTIVVHNGTPWPVEPAAPPDGPPIVGCLATLTPWKGQDLLLEAVAGLGRRDVVVELAGAPLPGDVPYAARLGARAAAPDLAGRVRLLGAVDDPLAVLRRWTVAVAPSREPEAFGLAVAEAMSVGVPVVAAAHGGVPEVLDGAGLLVPPGDVTALREALDRLLADPARRAAHGRAGRAAVASGLTLDAQRRAIEGALAGVLDEARRGAAASSAHAASRAAGRGRLDVVFVVPDYHPTVGGTTTHVANLARALRARGLRVAVLTQRRWATWSRRTVVDGIPVRRVGCASRSSLAMKATVAAVWWRLLRTRPRAVHVLMYPDFAVAARAAGLGPRTTMTWAGLGDATDTLAAGPLAWLRRRALGGVAHVALTPALARELDSLGLTAQIVPTPVDTERFAPPDPGERAAARQALGLAPETLAIVTVGHLRASKRVDRVIAALTLLRARGVDAHLVVVGDSRPELGDCRASLHAQVRELGLSAYVTFTGAVPAVERVLAAADVLVTASEREGMPNSVLEAMACGLACVVPVSAGGDQVLDHGRSGLVPSSATPEALAAALLGLADASTRRALGDAARAATAAYRVDLVADRYRPGGLGPPRRRRSRPPVPTASDSPCTIPAPAAGVECQPMATKG